MVLKGKVAIVTGASKGIGKGIAQRYSQEGATVVLASRSKDLLEPLAEEMTASGRRALALTADVRDAQSMENMVQRAVEEFGRVDIMVNNAGVSMTCPSEELTPADWENTLQTNLFGLFYGCQSAARQMIASDHEGCIINITSICGTCAIPQRAAYCASKAAANMLTKVLASEWAQHGIRVNAIAPGYIVTEMVQDFIDRDVLDVEALQRRTPMNRFGKVRELEGLAVFLAGPEAGFITGSVISADGGWAAYGYV